MSAATITQARVLAAQGDDSAALQAYTALLHHNPDHTEALIELAALAMPGGYRSAARTALQRAVSIVPNHPAAHTGLGDLLTAEGDLAAALPHYRTALDADPSFALAHQGLARCLAAMGNTDADFHFQTGFTGHAVIRQRQQGTSVPLLLLVSALGGNIPLQSVIDPKIYDVTTIYADYADPAMALPPHAAAFNAIGDADLCPDALAAAAHLLAKSPAPIINPPNRIRATGRAQNAQRLAAIPGLRTPHITQITRTNLAHEMNYPLLVRSPGFHTGQNFARVDNAAELAQTAANLPGEELLLIEYLTARGPDGFARKYRVLFIDGALHPLHMAASADWKVHYFTAGMAEHAALREEEQRFLTNMPAVLGPSAMAALTAIAKTLRLDYAGIDFGLTQRGTLLLFEANATMAIVPPDPDPIWDYRRPAVATALLAAQRLVAKRCSLP